MTNPLRAGTQPVHLDEIGQIAVTVTDLARSREFYENVLGFRFLFDAGTMSFFQCGKIRFAIGTSPHPATPGATILYFRVADIHRTHELLAARGVVFSHRPHLVAKMPDHDLWMAFFEDPDKNPNALMCELPAVAH